VAIICRGAKRITQAIDVERPALEWHQGMQAPERSFTEEPKDAANRPTEGMTEADVALAE
jgi:hypothetical protein